MKIPGQDTGHSLKWRDFGGNAKMRREVSYCAPFLVGFPRDSDLCRASNSIFGVVGKWVFFDCGTARRARPFHPGTAGAGIAGGDVAIWILSGYSGHVASR